MRFVLLCCIVVLLALVTPLSAESPQTTTPVAVLAYVAEDGSVTLHVDLGSPQQYAEQWRVPAQAQLRDLTTSPLPALVEALHLPPQKKDYLLLNGEPTPRPLPTVTPYVASESVPFMLTDRTSSHVTVVIPADVSTRGHRFVEVTCVACESGWVRTILSQLPDQAPVVVVGAFVAEIDGAWRIKALPVTFDGVVRDQGDARATLFVRQSLPIGSVRLSNQRDIADTPLVAYQYRDGRQRLLTVVLCLVGVLFMSVASFYVSIAVMRRMHAAVGYTPHDGK